MGDVLAVALARGQSERIPRKNMRDVAGEPLIWWTIQAAREAANVDRLVMSTEDVEIAAFCKRHGVEVVPQPIQSALSGTHSAPVVLSALDFLRDTEGYEPEAVVQLHPTSPLRTSAHIDEAIELWRDWRHSVISFTNDDLNGAIYVGSVVNFRAHGSFFYDPILPYNMDEVSGLDVDEWDDLERARRYMERRVAA